MSDRAAKKRAGLTHAVTQRSLEDAVLSEKPVTKGQLVYDFISLRSPEQPDPQTQSPAVTPGGLGGGSRRHRVNLVLESQLGR